MDETWTRMDETPWTTAKNPMIMACYMDMDELFPENWGLLIGWLQVSDLGSVTALAQELNDNGHRTKSWTTKKGKVRAGRPWNRAHIYRLLTNPTCLGLIKHKDKTYPGLHDAIVLPILFRVRSK